MGKVLNNQAGQVQQGASPAAPPPLPSETNYFVAVGGQQTGPFPKSVLAQKIKSNEVNRDSLVWAEGMAAWGKAGDQDDLKSLFGATPPPIPGV